MGRRLFGIADFREMNALARAASLGTVLVDGREVRMAFYVDTEIGKVMTFDLSGVAALPAALRDGKPHASDDLYNSGFRPPFPIGVDAPWDSAISLTIYGTVELFAAAEVACSR